MTWLGIAFVALTGALVIVYRRRLTAMQAYSVGARLKPGCAVAEGVVLLLIALLLAWLEYFGALR